MMQERLQFLRKFSLVVSGDKGKGLDLSQLRVTFEIEKSNNQKPNVGIFTIYNISKANSDRIRNEFTEITVQAGYESNFGVIFLGNIIQTRLGKDPNNVDNYLKIYAADGDKAYNFAVVNTTLAPGVTKSQQIDAVSKPMESLGTKKGNIDQPPEQGLPRGKVLYGNSREYLRQTGRDINANVSIQDGKLQIVKATSTLPNSAVLLTSQTGVIGSPERTENGIEIQALLNPLIVIDSVVKLDNASIQDEDRDPDLVVSKDGSTKKNENPDNAQKKLADKSSDGFYKVIAIRYEGDTRGNQWYSNLICVDVDATQPKDKQVRPNG